MTFISFRLHHLGRRRLMFPPWRRRCLGPCQPGGPWSDFTRKRPDFGMTSAFQTCATHVLVSKIHPSRLVQHSMAFPVGFPIFRLRSLQLSSRKKKRLEGPPSARARRFSPCWTAKADRNCFPIRRSSATAPWRPCQSWQLNDGQQSS